MSKMREQVSLLRLFFFQAEDGIRDGHVTGVQTCALPISERAGKTGGRADAVRPGSSGSAALEVGPHEPLELLELGGLRSEERRVGKGRRGWGWGGGERETRGRWRHGGNGTRATEVEVAAA